MNSKTCYPFLMTAITLASLLTASADPPFAETPNQLWEEAKENGKLKYIDGVPSIRSTTKTTPCATALVNVLQHLSTRAETSLAYYGLGALPSLQMDYENEYGDREDEPTAVGMAFMVKLVGMMERMAEGVGMQAADDLGNLPEWIAAATGKADIMCPLPSAGVMRSWHMATNHLNNCAVFTNLVDGLQNYGDSMVIAFAVDVDQDATFTRYKQAIDTNMPPVVLLNGTFMTGVGYWLVENDQYLIVHDPGTSEFKVRIDEVGEDTTKAFAEDYVGNSDEDLIPGCQFVLWDMELDLKVLEITGWQRDFNALWERVEKEVE